MNTRRQFLVRAPLGFLVAAAACNTDTPPAAPPQTATGATAGAPPTFGTGPASGPPVSPATFAEAEKLMQVTMTPAERQLAADSWRDRWRRISSGEPARVKSGDSAGHDAPATIWNPMLPGIDRRPVAGSIRAIHRGPHAVAWRQTTRSRSRRSPQLSRWIESRKLTSERLTQIYLSRIERLDPKIRSIITLTRDHALARAKAADAEIAAGKYRGPLHGIPYGVKDLLDTKGILTTYGAEPFRNARAGGGFGGGRAAGSTPAPC